jgi:hypothetical protein
LKQSFTYGGGEEMQLDKKALGLAMGILWGLAVLVMTVWALVVGGGEHMILLGKFYLGYSVSPVGAVIASARWELSSA